MACTFKKFRLFFVFFELLVNNFNSRGLLSPPHAAAPPPPARRLVGRWTTTRTGQAVLGRSCARAPCGGVTLMTRCTPRSRGGCGSAHPAPAQLAVPPRTWTAVDGYRAGTRRAGAPRREAPNSISHYLRALGFKSTASETGKRSVSLRSYPGESSAAVRRPCPSVLLSLASWPTLRAGSGARTGERELTRRGARPHPMQRSASSAREVHPRVSGYTRTNLKRATAMLFRAVAVREYTCAVVCGLDARSFPVHSGDERTSRTKRFQILPPPRRMRASPHAPSGGTQLERWRYRIAGDAGV